MKKILSAALALALALSMVPAAFAAGGTAYASTQAVEVDGKQVEFQMYALKDADGNPTNYVKLRDVAHVLNGTKAQFAVGYDGSISVTTETAYTDVGGEMTTPYSGDRTYREGSGAVTVNGQATSLESIILTDDAGGDYTYFKLRDLGAALGFTVDWSAERGVIVETGGAAQPSTIDTSNENGYYTKWPQARDLGAFTGVAPISVEESGGMTSYKYNLLDLMKANQNFIEEYVNQIVKDGFARSHSYDIRDGIKRVGKAIVFRKGKTSLVFKYDSTENSGLGVVTIRLGDDPF